MPTTTIPPEPTELNLEVMESTALGALRNTYYARRKSLFFRFHLSNRVSAPSWIKHTPYEFIYQDAPDLIKHGTIVWAYLVQANRRLFAAGRDDHPAHLVFGNDDKSNDLEVLKGYGEYLTALKVADDLPVLLRDFTSAIKSETPAFNKVIPNTLTPQYNVCFTTTIIHRKFLPNRKLEATWFPLLVDPMRSNASIVLPSRYWSREILGLWTTYKEWCEELADQIDIPR